MKHPANIDVAVLILFFNRPDHLKEVFTEIQRARPSKLFLFQDGPRGERDMEGIEGCRAIVSDDQIDWECEVHRNYQEKNLGCDPSEYLSQKWAFSIVDKCIVLEDDDVPSQSFFPFCKELLDRYENDERIWMISGFNIDEVTPDTPYDYFFTQTCNIWGWASWRRVIEKWDGKYSFLDDDYAMQRLRGVVHTRKYRNEFIKMCYDHRASGKEYYESIFWSSMILHSALAIMPTRNLINNRGLSTESTHFTGNIHTTPRAFRRIFTMKRHELQFPLRHPKYVIEDTSFKERLYRVHAWGHPWIKVSRSLEELWLNLRYGNFKHIGQAICNRFHKWTGKKKHS